MKTPLNADHREADSRSDRPWNLEPELADLLATLSEVQVDLLRVLEEKRQRLIRPELPQLEEIQAREAQLVERLQACQERRAALLARAADEGLPSASIKALTGALPADARRAFAPRIDEASARARLLQHHSLTNWVVVQRTLLHLSHILEIIATGGRMQPTYGKGDAAQPSGGLVDQAA